MMCATADTDIFSLYQLLPVLLSAGLHDLIDLLSFRSASVSSHRGRAIVRFAIELVVLEIHPSIHPST